RVGAPSRSRLRHPVPADDRRDRLPPPRFVRKVRRVTPQRASKAGWLVLGIALVGFPLIGGDFYVNLTSQIFIAAILAASLTLLVGYGGLVSLGHAAWVGLAAYIPARLDRRLGFGPWGGAPRSLPATPAL